MSRENPLEGFRQIGGAARAARGLGTARGGGNRNRSRSHSVASQSSAGSDGGPVGPASSNPVLTGVNAGLVRHLKLQAKERQTASLARHPDRDRDRKRSAGSDDGDGEWDREDSGSGGGDARLGAIAAARTKAKGLGAYEDGGHLGDALTMGAMGGGHGGVMRSLR